MTITEKIYAEFSRLLEEDKVYLDESLDFVSICGTLGVNAQEFDAFLMGELGYSGQQILEKYRKLH